jgi:hypothetical protein
MLLFNHFLIDCIGIDGQTWSSGHLDKAGRGARAGQHYLNTYSRR